MSHTLNPLDGRDRATYREESRRTALEVRESLKVARMRVEEVPSDETLDLSEFNAWQDVGKRRSAVDSGVVDKDYALRATLGDAGVRHMESVRQVSGALHAVVSLLANEVRSCSERLAAMEVHAKTSHEFLDVRITKVAESLEILSANVSGMDAVSEEEEARLEALEEARLEQALEEAQRQKALVLEDAKAAKAASDDAMAALGMEVSHSRPASATKDRIVLEETEEVEDAGPKAMERFKTVALQAGQRKVKDLKDAREAEKAAQAAAKAERDRAAAAQAIADTLNGAFDETATTSSAQTPRPALPLTPEQEASQRARARWHWALWKIKMRRLMTRGFSLTRGKVTKQMTIANRLAELERKLDQAQWEQVKLKHETEQLGVVKQIQKSLVDEAMVREQHDKDLTKKLDLFADEHRTGLEQLRGRLGGAEQHIATLQDAPTPRTAIRDRNKRDLAESLRVAKALLDQVAVRAAKG